MDADTMLRAMAHHVDTREAYSITFSRDSIGLCRITYDYPQGLRNVRIVGTGPTQGHAAKDVLDQLGLQV